MTARKFTRKGFTSTVAGLAAATLVLAACGSEEADSGSGDGASGDGGGEAAGEVTIGYIPSWTDGRSTAFLLEHYLEEQGYEVEMQTLTDAPLLYTALSEGDVDIFASAWPEVTQAEYMEEYSDGITDWGTYYDGAVLTMAVPEYVDIDSIDELNENADMFEGRIVGIEPGAGLTGVMEKSVIPTYGLDENFEFTTSSTTAMLAELSSAVDSEEPIVVTLWRPFWANSEFPVKDLEDPEGALGETEGLHFLANNEFAEENPELGEFISTIKLDDAQYGALESTVVNDFEEGDEAAAIDAWLEEYPDVIQAPEAAE